MSSNQNGNSDSTPEEPFSAPESPTPGSSPELPDDLSIDAEFLRLAAELDDIPGFTQLNGSVSSQAGGPRDWPTSNEVEALEDAENSFIPPNPRLDLSGSPIRVAGWIMLTVGIAVLLVASILHRYVHYSIGVAGGVLMIAGIIVLLFNLPGSDADQDHHDFPDDGAVV